MCTVQCTCIMYTVHCTFYSRNYDVDGPHLFVYTVHEQYINGAIYTVYIALSIHIHYTLSVHTCINHNDSDLYYTYWYGV